VPDGGGQGEDALQDADGDSGRGVPAVALEVELSFEGVVDRLDDLAQRLEEPGSGPAGLALAGRAQQRQAGVYEAGLKFPAVVVLVPDEDLPGAAGGQARAGGF
jgi:hypothetical protein